MLTLANTVFGFCRVQEKCYKQFLKAKKKKKIQKKQNKTKQQNLSELANPISP